MHLLPGINQHILWKALYILLGWKLHLADSEETLSLQDKELEMIKQALIRTNGRRKNAAKELGISERTLYRKIKQHNLGDVSEF